LRLVAASTTLALMPTSVRLPAPLLARVDARGVALDGARSEWPPELIALLETPLDAKTAAVVEETLAEVRRRRENRCGGLGHFERHGRTRLD